MLYKLYPYKLGSASAKSLAQTLNCMRVRPDGRYQQKRNHLIINWGQGRQPEWEVPLLGHNILNHWDSVSTAGNKLTSFRALERAGVPIPRFTTDADEAVGWDKPFVARHKLRGHSGEGAEYKETADADTRWRTAPLFVEYKKKAKEYRVHVFQGHVIDIQEKRKRREVDNDDVDYKIRNKYTGWVYCRDIDPVPDSITDAACSAIHALNLDFGAVDIIWNSHEQRAYVLEVNTAPGLEGTTLDKYVECFSNYINLIEEGL